MTFSNKNPGILDLLGYSRPHDSGAEKAFIRRFIDTLPGVSKDSFGNAWLNIPGNGDDILWSCHVDTVTNFDGMQKVKVNALGIASLDLPFIAPVVPDPIIGPLGIVSLPFCKSAHWGRVLGGDDSAGVFLMREMILAGKPGGYVFHRGEECGGLGSAHVRANESHRLEPYCAAIALDRAGYTSVITHQFRGETASLPFALSLAKALAKAGMKGYKPDSTGTFTDTANYADIIPECSNLSIGYAKAHSPDETLDTGFVLRLRDALVKLDLSRLDIVRDPLEVISQDMPGWDMPGWDNQDMPGWDSADELVEAIRRNPGAAARILQDYGLEDSFLDSVYYKGR